MKIATYTYSTISVRGGTTVDNMNSMEFEKTVVSYRDSLARFGNSPEAVQWSSHGQNFRFKKIYEMAVEVLAQPLHSKSVLEVGSGLGHFFEYVCKLEKVNEFDYTGVDIVPEFTEQSRNSYPAARFDCIDIIGHQLEKKFDVVCISGVFNAPYRNDANLFLQSLLLSSWELTTECLVFNFTGSRVNFIDDNMNYFNPTTIIDFVIDNLSPKIEVSHYYENCDVAISVRK